MGPATGYVNLQAAGFDFSVNPDAVRYPTHVILPAAPEAPTVPRRLSKAELARAKRNRHLQRQARRAQRRG